MSELDDQIHHRRAKRAALEAAGVEVYPARWPFDLTPSEVVARYGEATAEALDTGKPQHRVPGRIRAIRRHGKAVFADLADGDATVQLFIRTQALGGDAATVLEALDLGDLVGATGTVMRTRTGELSLAVDGLTMLAKALRPLPDKWAGLADVEARYRQRYLDLMANPESRRVFQVRSAMVAAIRRFLDAHGFLEVETPMLQPVPGGATARPFVTHHNALDVDLYLRIAPELYLKRLLVGGFDRVYEINRNFRNEGISTRHNPEFTMLEFYWAFVDYEVLMDFTEEMLTTVAEQVLGTTTLTWKGEELDLARPWPRLTMRQAIAEHGGVEAARLEDAESLRQVFAERGLAVPAADDYGHLLMELFEQVAEEHLVRPTFLTHHPVEVSPLAKQDPEDPRFTERFELYIAGMELANAFSELNDPDVQAERFEQQVAARESGDLEAHLFDADYVRALEHGMPPAGGCGIGIDRLTMLLTDRPSIRDVILFPLLRPEPPDEAPVAPLGVEGEGVSDGETGDGGSREPGGKPGGEP
jgi:lysyl-tRNA synthetase class 2